MEPVPTCKPTHLSGFPAFNLRRGSYINRRCAPSLRLLVMGNNITGRLDSQSPSDYFCARGPLIINEQCESQPSPRMGPFPQLFKLSPWQAERWQVSAGQRVSAASFPAPRSVESGAAEEWCGEWHRSTFLLHASSLSSGIIHCDELCSPRCLSGPLVKSVGVRLSRGSRMRPVIDSLAELLLPSPSSTPCFHSFVWPFFCTLLQFACIYD